MLKSYFLIAWRGLVKNRVYSFINLTGLATGMAVVMLISLWIRDELSYNKGFANYDHIVRVMVTQTNGNDVRTSQSIPFPLVVDLRGKFPGEFKKVAAASWNSMHILVVGDKQLNPQGMFVEPDMIDILALRTLDGRKASLDDPSSILLNESVAKALFGSADATGKTLKFDDSTVFRVAGVFADLPYSSDLKDINYFAPWANYRQTHPWVKTNETTWSDNSHQAFAQLQDGVDADKVEAKVKHELDGHGLTDKSVVLLHPMSHWHLYDSFVNGMNVQGAVVYVWMFGAIGLFVLVLACINFMNLSTARSEKRAKEVGIRKSVGSGRRQLIGQFLGESVFFALLAFGLAVLMVALALPWFNHVADKQMQVLWDSLGFWAVALGGTLLVGLLAGSYPAFYLSSFNAVKVLKGSFKAGRAAILPRRILIVLQFTVSVALIVCTIIVYQEIVHVKDRPVGYSRAGLVTFDILDKVLPAHFEALRQELLQSGVAADATMSSSPMTDIWNNYSGFNWEGKDPNFAPTFAVFYNDFDYGRTVRWDIVAGRDFARDYPSDSLGVVLNESAVRYMGLKNPIGAKVRFNVRHDDPVDLHVIGVVKDMVMNSAFAPVKQAIYLFDRYDMGNVVTVRINPGLSVSQAMTQMAAIFSRIDPHVPLSYYFAEEEYAKKFALEDRIGKLAAFFTALAILISCLGLFGLASFMAEQRIKEIGVRKVLGATVVQLWMLLSRDFMGLVGISFLIAFPIAYRVMSGWLLHYPYRVGISVWVFVVTMGAAMGITFLTVSWQAVRAARANPVKSLRTE